MNLYNEYGVFNRQFSEKIEKLANETLTNFKKEFPKLNIIDFTLIFNEFLDTLHVNKSVERLKMQDKARNHNILDDYKILDN